MSSAATSPAAARGTTRTGAHRARRTWRLSARAGGLAVVVVLLLTLAVAPFRTLMDQRSQLGQLQRQTEELERENADLQARIQRFDDPAYMEQLARTCLGMVLPGEIAFVTVPERGAPFPLDC
ncbi:MAG: FtsB family cell division protein [Actinomycetota bacterium]